MLSIPSWSPRCVQTQEPQFAGKKTSEKHFKFFKTLKLQDQNSFRDQKGFKKIPKFLYSVLQSYCCETLFLICLRLIEMPWVMCSETLSGKEQASQYKHTCSKKSFSTFILFTLHIIGNTWLAINNAAVPSKNIVVLPLGEILPVIFISQHFFDKIADRERIEKGLH